MLDNNIQNLLNLRKAIEQGKVDVRISFVHDALRSLKTAKDIKTGEYPFRICNPGKGESKTEAMTIGRLIEILQGYDEKLPVAVSSNMNELEDCFGDCFKVLRLSENQVGLIDCEALGGEWEELAEHSQYCPCLMLGTNLTDKHRKPRPFIEPDPNYEG